jgi:hypothetical protein
VEAVTLLVRIQDVLAPVLVHVRYLKFLIQLPVRAILWSFLQQPVRIRLLVELDTIELHIQIVNVSRSRVSIPVQQDTRETHSRIALVLLHLNRQQEIVLRLRFQFQEIMSVRFERLM